MTTKPNRIPQYAAFADGCAAQLREALCIEGGISTPDEWFIGPDLVTRGYAKIKYPFYTKCRLRQDIQKRVRVCVIWKQLLELARDEVIHPCVLVEYEDIGVVAMIHPKSLADDSKKQYLVSGNLRLIDYARAFTYGYNDTIYLNTISCGKVVVCTFDKFKQMVSNDEFKLPSEVYNV